MCIRDRLNIVQSNSFQPEQLDRSIDGQTLAGAQAIVDTVRAEGEAGIRKYAAQFGERTDDQPLLIGPDEMNAARERLDSEDLALLQRVAKRIRAFAKAQLESLSELKTPVPGGFAGHTIEPIVNVGCYAPAGRFALPLSLIHISEPTRPY